MLEDALPIEFGLLCFKEVDKPNIAQEKGNELVLTVRSFFTSWVDEIII